jgi:cysteine synthase A
MMVKIYNSILDTIGNTPIVRLARLVPADIEIYAKLEAFNPLGSVKDRLALGVIEAAERDGRLKPGQTVIEATSGNTGIGLAMVCARKGYPLVIVMAESFSVERRKLMRFLGAQVVLTPASEKGTGMVEKARELAAAHGWFWTRQFENEANPDIHSKTTAQEILHAFGGTGPDFFVTGAGTGGTLKGVSRVLRAESPSTRVIVAEPENAQILAGGSSQAYQADGTPVSHALFRPHPMQGWSPDFIPRLTADALDGGLIDAIQAVNGAEAIRLARELARQEGIFCGITGGATLAAALEVAKTAPKGSRILFMVPDTGERYLSTPLFESIGQEMDAEEEKISNSTPRCRFVAPTTAPAVAASIPNNDVPRKAIDFVTEAVTSREQPVVMFALEWCEFSWAARWFLRDLGVPFRSVELDSVAMQAEGFGGDIRKALRVRTGEATIPQIFIGGVHVGGAVDFLKRHDRGELLPLMNKAGIIPNGNTNLVAQSYLPKWLAARSAA